MVRLTGFCNWLDMAGQWGELSKETPHLFPLDGLLNNHLICFNLWLWREGCRWRGASLALQPSSSIPSLFSIKRKKRVKKEVCVRVQDQTIGCTCPNYNLEGYLQLQHKEEGKISHQIYASSSLYAQKGHTVFSLVDCSRSRNGEGQGGKDKT